MDFSFKFVLNIVIIVAGYHLLINFLKFLAVRQAEKLQHILDEMEEHDKQSYLEYEASKK